MGCLFCSVCGCYCCAIRNGMGAHTRGDEHFKKFMCVYTNGRYIGLSHLFTYAYAHAYILHGLEVLELLACCNIYARPSRPDYRRQLSEIMLDRDD